MVPCLLPSPKEAGFLVLCRRENKPIPSRMSQLDIWREGTGQEAGGQPHLQLADSMGKRIPPSAQELGRAINLCIQHTFSLTPCFTREV